MKAFVKALVTIMGAVFLYGCQGPLDSDISEYFDIDGNKSSASCLPSDGNIDASSTPTVGGNGSGNSEMNPEEIAKKLVGKWILTKQVIDDGYGKEEGYHHSGVKDESYIVFNADYTYEQSDPYIFEDQSPGDTWRIEKKQIVFEDRWGESRYTIMQLTSSTLQLLWADESAYYELTTFRKAN